MDKSMSKSMHKKKLAAVIAAVNTYIKTDEEIAAQNIHTDSPIGNGILAMPVHQANNQVNVWGISGRQELMQSNTMMQLRMFK